VIADMDPWAAAAVLGAGMVAGWFVGWRWGRWHRTQGREAPEGKLEDSALALLGLLLAFTSHGPQQMTAGEALVDDSNAIGDLHCASLAPDSVREAKASPRIRAAAAQCGGGLSNSSGDPLPRVAQMQAE
jgi:hypothetical protein